MATSPVLIVPLILSLSLDTFAVSVAVGIAPLARGLRLRFAAACALAEAGMPLLGYAMGGLAHGLGRAADWLAVALLLGAGLWMAREALEDEVAEALERASTGGGAALVLAALSVSLDELAVGLAFGTLRLQLVPVVTAIAVQAVVASLLGLRLGAVLGARAGARAALLAGLALCGVGLWLALAQLLGWGGTG
jgi:manganese efflux pump family protein